MTPPERQLLQNGLAIPACPLALTGSRALDERRQRALLRYYLAAGAGGVAVGVHTTQFAIRDPGVDLFRPLLELAADEMRRIDASTGRTTLRIGGICGATPGAVQEAALLRRHGFHAGLASLGALAGASEDALVAHCKAVGEIIPLIGFYLQPAVGGRRLSFRFWRRLAELPCLVAIKIAPFNRYQTLDVVRAVVESGRDDIALYTGNDDNIVCDLLTPFRFERHGRPVTRRIAGGLLGHWAVWTHKAVELLRDCQAIMRENAAIPPRLMTLSAQVTDANAAFFDAANGYRGCIAGLHEVLRRQGLFENILCLDPAEGLSPGQSDEIDRVYKAYPHLNDDAFVRNHLDGWMKD